MIPVLALVATATITCPTIPLDQPLSEESQAVFCVALKTATKLGECKKKRASDAVRWAKERKAWRDWASQLKAPATASPSWMHWAGPLGVGLGGGVMLGGSLTCVGVDCNPVPALAAGGVLALAGGVIWLIEEVSK